MVKPEMIPDQIIAEKIGCRVRDLHTDDRYNGLKQHLINYKKSGMGWDDYASKKMEVKARDLLGRILKECQRNGFIRCRVKYAKGAESIVFDRIVHPARIGYPEDLLMDLCSMCQRDCRIKDPRGVLLPKAKRCWEKEGGKHEAGTGKNDSGSC